MRDGEFDDGRVGSGGGRAVLRGEVLRYALNGAVATAIHFLVFIAAAAALGHGLHGVANGVGSAFGIAASFLGSRYFVFPHRRGDWRRELARFLPLYASLAVLNMLIMYLWSDLSGFNKEIGFVIATLIQVAATFFGNKYLVFRNDR